MKLSSIIVALTALLSSCGQETTISTADRTVTQNAVVITGTDGRRYVMSVNENPDPKVLINLQTLASNALTLETAQVQQAFELQKLNSEHAHELAMLREQQRQARFFGAVGMFCLSCVATVLGVVGIRHAWKGRVTP